MGFFKKISDLARSNINDLLGKLEDPKKMADQALIDLKEGKNKAQALLIKAQGRAKLMEQKMLKLREDAAELLAKAEHLLKGSDEENARLILEKKQAISQEKSFYEEELKQEQLTIETLKRGLKAIDAKVDELKLSAKDIGMNIIQKTDAFDNFSRMEEKIESNEYEIEALKELFASEEQGEKKDAEKAPFFDKHSDPEALEKELLAIKNKLNS